MRNPRRSRYGVCARPIPAGLWRSTGIDFSVSPGEVFGLLGPNGAGKSTTIGMLTTTVAPDRRHGASRGYDVVEDPIGAPGAARSCSRKRSSTARSPAGATSRSTPGSGASARQRRRRASTTSSGASAWPNRGSPGREIQRRPTAPPRDRPLVALAPQVLFLDEPTVGLDPRIRYELLDLIGDLRAGGGMTIVLTTHYLDEAERLCDRIAIVHAGEIVALDTPARCSAAWGPRSSSSAVDADVDARSRACAPMARRRRCVRRRDDRDRAVARRACPRESSERRGVRRARDRDDHPSAVARRRLSPPHRRPPRARA